MPVYSCAIKHTYAGQDAINVIGFAREAITGAETGSEATIVANAVASAWNTRMMPKLSAQLVLNGVEARGMVVREVSGLSTVGTGSGTVLGASLPSFVAARILMSSDTPGRAGRGRTGLAGITEVMTQAASPNSLEFGERQGFQTAYDFFVADLAALVPTLFPVVISRFKGTGVDGKPLPRPGGPIASKVTTSSVQVSLGTRVSRLR